MFRILSQHGWSRVLRVVLVCAAITACGGGTTYVVEPNSCTSLANASLPDITIDNIRVEPATAEYPEHCLIRGRTLSNRVRFELRSPLRDAWNRRLLMQGTGGFAGQLDPAIGSYRTPTGPGLLAQNYAVATNDAGHTGNQQFETYFLPLLDGSWALNNPVGEEDFAWRGAAAATTAARTLMTRIAGTGGFRTYWVGCSGGGRMGLKLAEQADALFDGFVIGGPPVRFARAMARAHWNTVTAQALPLSPAKLRFISQKVLDRCDALDGAADGLVSHPSACRFNPFEFLCTAGDGADCLTETEAIAAQRHYDGPVDRAGNRIARGLPPTGAEDCGGLCDGSEGRGERFREGWGWWFAGGPPSALDLAGTVPLTPDRAFGNVLATQFFRFLARDTDSPNLRWFEFDPVNDASWLTRSETLYDVQRTNFSAFRTSGKRILLYSGWGDAFVSPLEVLDFHARVEAASGGAAATSEMMRLFMVPGMQHCEGGRALDEFDAVNTLVRWVENGEAPDTMRARNRWTSAFPGRERDLCAHPRVSFYRGRGSFDDPASFECRLPG